MKLFSVFFCLLSVATAWSEDQTLLGPGTPAPGFSLPSLTGSREALSVWCGKDLSKPFLNSKPRVVILSFWATYCGPCQKEIPVLHKFYEKHAADSLKVFLVSIDEQGADIVSPAVAERKYSLPVLLDPYKKTSERYGVKSLPAMFVIGADGLVKYSASGFRKDADMATVLDQIYDAVKNGKPVPASIQNASAGETVAVVPSISPPVPAPEPSATAVTARQKWAAVAKMASGISADSVAHEMGVPADSVKKWSEELKSAAKKIWGDK